MRYTISFFIFGSIILWQNAQAAFKPCLGMAYYGEECDGDADCGQTGTYCHPTGTCDCHPAYELANSTDSNTGALTYTCQKLPDKFGQACDKKCAEPLYCEDQKCTCKFSVRDGDTCKIENGVNSRCLKHTDCTEPFTACVANKCICIAGTKEYRGKCVAEKNCPLGGKAGRDCVRASEDPSVFVNAASPGNVSLTLSTCPDGQYCVTAPGSTSGHCCQATCPLNTNIKSEYSCEEGATKFCPQETHFCHRVAGSNYAFAVCCTRPCQNGGHLRQYHFGTKACHETGFLESDCVRDEDCDGGATMRCSSGKCVCQSGFEPKRDPLTDSESNPPQRCVKSCSTNSGRDTECYSVGAELQQGCYIQDQCPTGSACFRGRCECRCGLEERFGRCEAPTTTPAPSTEAPRTRPGQTVTNKPKLPNIFGNLGNILGGGGNGGGGGLGGGAGGGAFGDLLGKFIPGGLGGGGALGG